MSISIFIPLWVFWLMLDWVIIGMIAYVPLDMWLSHKLAKVNMGFRAPGPWVSIKRLVAHPKDTFLAFVLWPYVAYQVWKA